MPRVVDHEERRRQLGEAVWRVIRRDGVRSASVRAVATEAGWSAGALRHYFTTQSELILFATELVIQRVQARMPRHFDEPRDDPYLRAQEILEEVMPMDEEREVECLVWLAVTDLARFDPALGAVREHAFDGTRHLCRLALADILGSPWPQDWTDPMPDPAHEDRAERLHAFVDGLTLHGIVYPTRMPPERLRAVLRDHLRTM
jgi:AcrR family transcriptional regulator